ncbi:MAG TPA: DUF4214 domain-containing protein [Pirellulales bacterium]|nr:DUF4214 domain-containing protein [Pirellulales bacterium]
MLSFFLDRAARWRQYTRPEHRQQKSLRSRPAARWGQPFRRCALERCEERVLLTFHLWKIDQVFSSADGKVQFIELHDPADGENHTGGHTITSNENTFTFPANLPTDATANQHFLIATADYAALPGAVTPDYIIPDNFFNPAGDTLDYADVDEFTFTAAQMPTDGVNSLMRDFNTFALSTGHNSETDLAGQTGSITASATQPSQPNQPPTIDAIADPAPIPPSAGAQTINLTGISAGAGQTETVTITAASDNTSLIPNPTVTYTSPSATGSLTYTPVPGALGIAHITVTAKNSGGTANGGSDTTVRTFTVTVAAQAPPPTANLAITANGPSTGQPGTPLTFSVTVTNSGGAGAVGATVTDTLPTGLTNITAVDTAGTVNVSGNTITDTLGSLAATTGREILTITATPTAALSGTNVTNTATLSFQGATHSASAATSIGAGAPPPAATSAGFLMGVVGDGTPQTFVHNLYRELLGREPETSGDNYWIAQVDQQNNAAGRANVVQGFLNSTEYKNHYITTLYQIFLGRTPDAAGAAFWTGKMGNPGTPGQHDGSADEKSVLAAILGSDEVFTASGNTPQGWINTLFEDLFGRAADGSGLDFWLNEFSALGDGNRDELVRNLLDTPEAAHDLLDAFFPSGDPAAGQAPAAAGAQAGTGLTDLARLTGAGWENIYLEGASGSTTEGNDSFFAALSGGGNWDDVQAQLLASDQFYDGPAQVG